MDTLEKAFLEYMKRFHTGKENAVHSKELEALFFISDRKIRNIVRKLRDMKCPICSGSCGYYYAKDRDELEDSTQWLKQFASAVSDTVISVVSAKVIEFNGKVLVIVVDGGLK